MFEVLKLKVYKNKRNSQAIVMLPKKKFNGKIPKVVSLKIRRRKKI